LRFKHFGVIDVMTAKRAEQRRFKMTFTIDTDNNISAFATQEEAAAATTTTFESFTSQKELAQLASAWARGTLGRHL
jgi:lysyl-tRNA synthetase class II